MKIILTGATGFVGAEVLNACLKHMFITHVYAVVRKPLDPKIASHKKCTEIIHDDFEKWPETMMRLFQEEGVKGCIWCIGGWVGSFPDLETAQRVNIAMPQAAAEAFATHLAPSASSLNPKSQRSEAFRFVYLSNSGAEQNQFASLWVQVQTRKTKGAAEKGLFDFADSRDKGTFEVYSLRLGRVLAGGQTVANVLQEGVSVSVSNELVAKFCINTVLDGRFGDEGGRIVENAEILGPDWADINVQHI